MAKLSDLFTPQQAREFLLEQFSDSPRVKNKVLDMTKKQLQVFACLVSGYSLGEIGRNLPVNVSDVALNGRAGELIHVFNLPIQRPRIELENDNGTKTKRTIYYMNRGDIELLKSSSHCDQVLKSTQKLSCIRQTRAENSDLGRIIKKRGRDTATVRALTVGTDASRATKKRLKKEIQSLMARYKIEAI